jgi:hypothetical protein
MRLSRTTMALCLFPCFLFVGCDSEHIATYPSMSDQQAMQILIDRSRRIRTVSAQGLVTLERPSGEIVRLDAALAIQPPTNARLRAWKLGQAVFDITLTPQGLWVVTPQEDQTPFGDHTANVTRQWLRSMTGTFEDAGVIAEDSVTRLILKQQADNGATIVCEVDRKTLTARRYILRNRDFQQRFQLTLSRYAEFNGIVWPQRIEAVGPSGSITIDLREIEINGELPSAAFHPPARAVKLAETLP